MAPIEYTSARSSSASPSACSGGMYAGVPITDPTTVSAVWGGVVVACGNASSSSPVARFFASPQSITTVSPYAPTSTLPGLRSRWMTFSPCAYASASATAITCGTRATRSAVVFVAAISASSVRPATSFIA